MMMQFFCSGGYFGAGWIRDLWRIPTYVKDANDDPEYLKNLAKQMNDKKRPPISVSKISITAKMFYLYKHQKTIEFVFFLLKFARMGGQLVIGNLFGLLTQMCIPGPEDVGVDLLLVADLLAPLATAIGM